ncbi:MAG: hypothetical protein U0R44_04440 [Candidatus Micrarchaeia archaeon]
MASPEELERYENSLVAEALNPKINESTIGQVEAETRERVKKMIAQLEEALAAWKASGGKPPELAKNFERYQKALDALKGWEASKPKFTDTFETRIQRLRDLVRIAEGIRPE